MIRALARPLLASWFVYGGVRDALEPQVRAAAAEPTVGPLLDKVTPALKEAGIEGVGVEDVVRVHGAATAAAATVLAFSRTPRTAGLALTALAGLTVASTTPFWKLPEGPERDAATEEFLKNLSLMGGAMIAASAGHSVRHVQRKKARKAKAKAKAAEVKSKAAQRKVEARREAPGLRGWAARKAA